MSWRYILFVTDDAGHIGPRLLRKLSHLAAGFDAEVELFQPAFEWGMLRKGGLGSLASDLETRSTLQRRRNELEAVVHSLECAGVRARCSVSSERPGYHSILRHVLASKPQLLIVQSARRSAIARLVLTYTDFKLIEMCPCPLLLMKTEKSYRDASIVAAIDPMHAHDKPAALDEAIVDAGASLASALGATLHVCHAIVPGMHDAQAQSRIEELARRASLDEERIHLPAGDPVKMVPRCARSQKAQLVIMGAVSRSGLERVFIGHTAERVLDALACDVLVIKPPRSSTADVEPA